MSTMLSRFWFVALLAFFTLTVSCLDFAVAKRTHNSCVQVACSYANDCSSDAAVAEYAEACRGVDGTCVQSFCNYRSCDLKTPLLQTIYSCKGVDSSCVQLGCFMGHCSLSEGARSVAQSCQSGVDTACVRSLCTQRGDCSLLSRFTLYTSYCR